MRPLAFLARSSALAAFAVLAACTSPRDVDTPSPEARRATLAALGVTGEVSESAAVLPERASGAAVLEDTRSGVGVRVVLRGASEARGSDVGGVRLHRAAYRGADVARVTTTDGMEDFVFFDARPADEALEYDVDVSKAAGLRLVGGVLEVLDTKGAPRLRVVPPYVVDAKGAHHAGSLSVEGCKVDTHASDPRDRAVLAPGASTCGLRVTWKLDDAGYPAVVDPSWQGTMSPSFGRYDHASLALSDGRVIIVGGWRRDSAGMGNGPQALCEIFSPSSRTWAVSSFLVNSRQNPALAQYPSGKVLAVGGGFGRVQVFVPGQGIDAPMESVTSADFLTATMLGNGKALVLGGFVDGTPSASALLVDEANPGSPTNAGPTGVMGAARGKHTATLLVSGKVLVAGGEGPGGKLASAEIYDPATNTFAPTAGPMMAARSAHAAVRLTDGRVLLAGGGTTVAELYDPATNQFSVAGSLAQPRERVRAVRLASGRVMVAGGEVAGVPVGDVEIFDPDTRTFAQDTPLTFIRTWFGLSPLPNGDVLADGGRDKRSFGIRNSEIWSPTEKGIECRAGNDCRSGYCQQGTCCAAECKGPCKTCSPGTGACVPVISADDPDDCTGALTCDAAGACKKKNGNVCTSAGDCASGFCIDGFCCERACGGQCEACDVGGREGRCVPVAGEPHAQRPRCAKGDATCGGTCDGITTVCSYPSAVTVCGRSCGEKLETVSTCDGKGACLRGSPQSCAGNFVCASATACKTECASDADCLDGYRCEGKVCSPVALCKGTLVTKGREVVDCAPYTCEQGGLCRTSCASVADCAEPNVCSADGRCVLPPQAPLEGCATGAGSGGGEGGLVALAAALGMTLVRRRKR